MRSKVLIGALIVGVVALLASIPWSFNLKIGKAAKR